MRVHHQPAYVLLNRPYSESSWITELFSRDYGRLALIAKGARRIKSPHRGVLLPFQPLLISWTGKGEVPTLTNAEIQPSTLNLFEHELCGDSLICGFYCNELVTYLLHRHDPHPRLFEAYSSTIAELHHSNEPALPTVLRNFEQHVIRETGYEVNFQYESDGKTPILASAHYEYSPSAGFVRCSPNTRDALLGSVILSLQPDARVTESAQINEQFLSRGKQLMRAILSQSLGYRKINSRALFVRSLTKFRR